MNITIRYIDGKEYTGKSPSEVVAKMRSSSPFTAKQTISEYMRGYANRARIFHKRLILTASPLVFLLSLANTPEVEKFSVEIGERK